MLCGKNVTVIVETRVEPQFVLLNMAWFCRNSSIPVSIENPSDNTLRQLQYFPVNWFPFSLTIANYSWQYFPLWNSKPKREIGNCKDSKVVLKWNVLLMKEIRQEIGNCFYFVVYVYVYGMYQVLLIYSTYNGKETLIKKGTDWWLCFLPYKHICHIRMIIIQKDYSVILAVPGKCNKKSNVRFVNNNHEGVYIY